MKHKYLLTLVTVPLLASLSCFNSTRRKVEVNAYDKSSLPTTINLNDYSDKDIRSYYSNLNALSSEERTGKIYLKISNQFFPIIKNIIHMMLVTVKTYGRCMKSQIEIGKNLLHLK